MWGPNVPRVKKHPKYVHGKVGMAMLLHKIRYVKLRWYEYGNGDLLRLVNPILVAHTVCGAYWRIEAGRSGTCEIPKVDAVICGMCSGEGRIWSRDNKSPRVTKRQAKDRLGCAVEGTAF